MKRIDYEKFNTNFCLRLHPCAWLDVKKLIIL